MDVATISANGKITLPLDVRKVPSVDLNKLGRLRADIDARVARLTKRT
ncbi:MAG: hypothetical protein FWG15_07380 [Propionibacteriaceae bacterium]|nr:hypothetical protein [Propionibacteriaceae bacterium]